MAANAAEAPLQGAWRGQVRKTPARARVLVVEDDTALADGMLRMLAEQGYEVVHAASGEAALTALAAARFDVMVLDIGLPGIDGFEVMTRRDRAAECAVLIVSAYDRVDQRVRGLDLGADDYLVKPFAIEELEARIRALLRRSQAQRSAHLEFGGLAVDFSGKRAWVAGTPLDLTAREWSVLDQLLARVGQVVGKDQLQQVLAGDHQPLSDNAIEVYVSRLRVKLAGTGVNIRTVRGFGYMVEELRGTPR